MFKKEKKGIIYAWGPFSIQRQSLACRDNNNNWLGSKWIIIYKKKNLAWAFSSYQVKIQSFCRCDTQYICMLVDSDYFYRLGIPLDGSFFSSSSPPTPPTKAPTLCCSYNWLRIVWLFHVVNATRKRKGGDSIRERRGHRVFVGSCCARGFSRETPPPITKLKIWYMEVKSFWRFQKANQYLSSGAWVWQILVTWGILRILSLL